MMAIAGCTSPQSNTSNNESGAQNQSNAQPVAAVIKGLDNPFFQTMQQGIEDQAKTGSTSVTVQAANSLNDTTGQADKVQALAGQDYGCFIINPITQTNLVQPLVQVANTGKPIVNIDSPIGTEAAQAANLKVSTYIGTDNVSAGRLAAEEMARLLPNGGDVAMIGGVAGDATSQARLEGFQQGIPDNIRIVQTVSADWERQKALTTAGDILRARPDLKGFFVANDDMGLGVVRALADVGKQSQVKVISVDGLQDAIKAVQEGTLSATVAQYPYAIGAMGMEACQAAMAGKNLPGSVTAPVAVVNSSNADKALESFPKPFSDYDDPLADLLAQ
ncbi:substrate-binding domain-containing protein [Leptolyngbya sp. FACHB-16]|nr:substrate-binding domain-containing protein [Leptolyngbya sp. FACHB-8]MBD2157515.1 substrate-binding domain-containing protein [Leptolyngbya sp. FACHB-16]